jgi:ankyrin repeat protein
MERLIQENPNLEIRNHYGGNALIPAAEKGHYETAKLLLEKTDIDVDFINYLNWTALLEVVILSKDKDMQVKMAKLLLDHGATVSIKDKDGVDALAHAKKNKNMELVLLLESYRK